jgi:hypothetical protein
MMGGEDLETPTRHIGEDVSDLRHLLPRHAAVLARQPPRRVQHKGGHLVIREESRDRPDRSDMIFVMFEGGEHSLQKIEEGNVVIARDDELHAGDAVEEFASLREFGSPGALREVAADDHEVRPLLFQALEQRFRGRDIVPSEMKVREMSDGSHRAT